MSDHERTIMAVALACFALARRPDDKGSTFALVMAFAYGIWLFVALVTS